MKIEEAEKRNCELMALSGAFTEHESDLDIPGIDEATEKIDALLEALYCIIDILPKQVPEFPGDSISPYFAVEEYFLQEPHRSSIKQRHANVILKLNC